jgi:hypothetical protein
MVVFTTPHWHTAAWPTMPRYAAAAGRPADELHEIVVDLLP